MNNNNSGYGGDKRRDLVSDNIYANVDASNLNFNKNHGEPAPQIPGPQVNLIKAQQIVENVCLLRQQLFSKLSLVIPF